MESPGPRTAESTCPQPCLQNHIFQTQAPPSPLSGLQVAKPGCWAMLFYLRSLHRGRCEVTALGPLPPVSANISGGLQLRFCFSSLADVCFNLIKLFTGLGGWTRASVGPSPGGWWERWGRVPWARLAHTRREAQRVGKKDQVWAKLRFERSSPCLTFFLQPYPQGAPSGLPPTKMPPMGTPLGQKHLYPGRAAGRGSAEAPWKNC